MDNKFDRRTLLKSTAIGFAAVTFGAQAASHAGKEHKVDIVGFAFDPPSIEVKAGDTITWTNRDSARHTASADDGSWDTGALRKNQSGSVAITHGMAADYHCRFHPNMKASLTITMG